MKPAYLALAFALLLAASGAADAQAGCQIQQLAIRGTVVDAEGAPLPNVVVAARWEEKAGTLDSQRASDARGRFEVPIAWGTYSGRSFGGKDRCEFRLREIELEASKSGYRTLTQTFALDKLGEPLRLELVATR
jgi:hypothetical protein